MAEQAIAHMGLGCANFLLEIDPSISADRITALNIEAIFLRASSNRVASLLIKPFLDAPLNTWKGDLEKLILNAGIVCREDAALPFPYALFCRRHAGAHGCSGTEKQRMWGQVFDPNRPYECIKREGKVLLFPVCCLTCNRCHSYTLATKLQSIASEFLFFGCNKRSTLLSNSRPVWMLCRMVPTSGALVSAGRPAYARQISPSCCSQTSRDSRPESSLHGRHARGTFCIRLAQSSEQIAPGS